MFELASAFFGGCAEIFDIQIPYLPITFFQLLVGLLIIEVVLSSIYIVFGIHTETGNIEVSAKWKNDHINISK